MVRWLNDEEQRAWRGMIETISDIRAVLDTELQTDHDIDEGDYGVLVQLSEAEGRRMRMCDLAARLHLSPSGLTRRLDGMVRNGWVVRVPSDGDRRVILAALTPAGMRKLEKAAPDHVEAVRREVFDHLTATQVRQLANALDALRKGRTALAV